MAKLTRRELLKTTGVAAVSIATLGPASSLLSDMGTAEAATTGVWNHNPASPIGPLHWGDIGFPVCSKGNAQSPVNIRTNKVAPYRGSPLLLSYESSELVIENTGHVVEVVIPTGVNSTLQIGGDSYELVQYHFHTPGEHEVNGQLADVEAHFVHMNAQGVTAVVGVFYRLGSEPNALLDRILLSAPETAGEEITAGEASPAEMFHNIQDVCATGGGSIKVNSFYAYDGSLTTPGCTQNVVWSVLEDGGGVSHAAVKRFHELIAQFPNYDGYPNNNRPVLPLNGRVIKLRRDGD
jgi:carbonic anhydrase